MESPAHHSRWEISVRSAAPGKIIIYIHDFDALVRKQPRNCRRLGVPGSGVPFTAAIKQRMTVWSPGYRSAGGEGALAAGA